MTKKTVIRLLNKILSVEISNLATCLIEPISVKFKKDYIIITNKSKYLDFYKWTLPQEEDFTTKELEEILNILSVKYEEKANENKEQCKFYY